MDPLAKVVRDRMQAVPKPEAHPDANLLAAFAEKSLREAERNQVLEHLGHCSVCREVVAVSLPEYEMAAAVPAMAMASAPRAASSSWFRPRLLLRWGALAACVIVGAVVLLQKRGYEKPPAAAIATGENAPSELRANEQEYSVRKKSADTQTRMVARLEAPKSEARRETAAASPVPQRLIDKSSDGKGAGVIAGFSGGAAAGGLGRTANARDSSAFSVPPPPPLQATPAAPAAEASKSAALDLFKETQKKDTAVQEVVKVPSVNETVTVEAESAPVTTQSASVSESKLAKAKTNNGAAFGDKIQEETANIVTAQNNAKYLGDEKDALRSGVRFPVPRWTLSPKGELLRSLDLGESWHPVEVAPKVVFRALSVSGREVWAGGVGGALYHSADGGESWQQIKPVSGGHILSSDITGLEFTDAQHGTLSTANHETWTTADSGQNWQEK